MIPGYGNYRMKNKAINFNDQTQNYRVEDGAATDDNAASSIGVHGDDGSASVKGLVVNESIGSQPGQNMITKIPERKNDMHILTGEFSLHKEGTEDLTQDNDFLGNKTAPAKYQRQMSGNRANSNARRAA